MVELTGNDKFHIKGRPEEPPQVVTVKVLITQFSVTTFQVHLKVHEPNENSVRKSNKAKSLITGGMVRWLKKSSKDVNDT